MSTTLAIVILCILGVVFYALPDTLLIVIHPKEK